MPSFDDIKLTKAQQQKFDALCKAHEACLKAGIQFISIDDFMYPLNGKKIADISPNGIKPLVNPSKEFVAFNLPSGWDCINVEEPYCQTEITFELKKKKKKSTPYSE